MSIVILGTKFPVGDELLVIRSDGTCTKYHKGFAAFWEDGETSRPTMIETLHDHGRLVDVDDMERFMSDTVQGNIRDYPYDADTWDEAFRWIDSRPTVIPASE